MTSGHPASDRWIREAPGAEALVVAVLSGGDPSAEAVLGRLRAHRLTPAGVAAVAESRIPGLADSAPWRAAVEAAAEHGRRIARAIELTAAGLDGRDMTHALMPSALGPAWMRDVDVLVADVEGAAAALRDLGFVDLSRLGRPSGSSASLAALDGAEVLAGVDVSSGLVRGGPSEDAALRGAVTAGGVSVLALDDRIAIRAAKIARARRVIARDALELLLLLAEAPRPAGARGLGVAVRRCAALEAQLGVRGPFTELSGGRRATRDTAWLHGRLEGAARRARPSRGRRRVRVSFSGVDGAGKSTQAALLAQNLERAGVSCEAVWARLGYSGSHLLTAAADLAQRVLPARHHSAQRSRAEGAATPADRAPLSRRGPVGWLWALGVTVDYLRILRRETARADATVLVYDRGMPDAIVGLEEEFGGALDLRTHRRLVLRWGPRADVAILLRLPGDVARARKADSFAATVLEAHARRYDEVLRELGPGTLVLDAQRPREELALEILRAVARAPGPL